MSAALLILRQHWKLLTLAALAIALTVQTFRLQSTQSRLEAEALGREADRIAYSRAQAEATSAALAQRAKDEAEYQEKADAADKSIDDLRARLRVALMRTGQVSSPASQASGETESGSARLPEEVPAAAATDSGSMCVDADMLAGLSAYAIKAHEWAVGLDQ